jgi:sporulation protein YqfC
MRIRERLAGLMSVPKEIALNLPLIIVTGRDEVNIENFKGIQEYTDFTVAVNTSVGLLTVTGKKLRLRQVTSENIVVTGVIDEMRYS